MIERVNNCKEDAQNLLRIAVRAIVAQIEDPSDVGVIDMDKTEWEYHHSAEASINLPGGTVRVTIRFPD